MKKRAQASKSFKKENKTRIMTARMKLRSGTISSPEIESFKKKKKTRTMREKQVRVHHPVIFSNPVISNSDQDIYADPLPSNIVLVEKMSELPLKSLLVACKNVVGNTALLETDMEAKHCVSQLIFVCNLK